jgi:CRISPR-associated protein Cmr3
MLIRIDAFDTLFFRDGKPFEMGDDTWANGMFPPLPSVFYGALRTAYASQHNIPINDIDKETKCLKIKGIYLDTGADLVYPMPLDYVEQKDKENSVKHLKLLASDEFLSSKPFTYVPYIAEEVEQNAESIFTSGQFDKYAQGENSDLKIKKYSDLIVTENKVGIGRDNSTNIAKDSKLYRVAMRRLESKSGQKLSFIIDYEFVGKTNQDITGSFKLGAEGKIVKFKPYNTTIKKSVVAESKFFKIYLSTPAIFKNGNLPNFDKWFKGYDVKLLTAIVGKPFRVGGFDMVKREPKEMQTAVPAGSVYYFEIQQTDKTTLHLIKDLENVFSISDEKQDEGFGLYKICSLNFNSLIITLK